MLLLFATRRYISVCFKENRTSTATLISKTFCLGIGSVAWLLGYLSVVFIFENGELLVLARITFIESETRAK